MRTFTVFAFIFLFVSCAFADITVHDGKVTADVTARPLKEVLQGIEEQTGVKIILDEGVATTTVSAHFEGLPVPAGIRKLLEGTGINFAVVAARQDAPMQVFITGSEKPGAPPRKLDTRPVSTPARGVVTPVTPIQQPQPFSQENVNPAPRERQLPPGMQRKLEAGKPNQTPDQPQNQPKIPTAGGIGTPPPTTNPPQPNTPQEEIDEEGEEDYDDE